MPVEHAGRAFAPFRVATESEKGGTRVRCGRDSLRTFAAMLLSLGCRIVIHEPTELRATFKELAALAQQTAELKDGAKQNRKRRSNEGPSS
jgi:predicted DNA-binding transcriptional regulator YafY